jgi:hypothetical protein
MAHSWLGHDAEALRWMTEANAQMERELTPVTGGTGQPAPWNRRLTLQVLRREAESLLGANPQSSFGTKRAQPPNSGAASNASATLAP